jgi:hypothetical protein
MTVYDRPQYNKLRESRAVIDRPHSLAKPPRICSVQVKWCDMKTRFKKEACDTRR